MRLALYIENHLPQETSPELESMWRRAAETALAERDELSDRSCELNLLLCDNEEIKEYNAEYRSIDKATDVLSFPMIEDWQEIGGDGDIPVIIGDIIISMERAAEQAEEYGHSFEREAVFLFVHGLLHCLGYDHIEPEDEEEMRARQREILAALHLEIAE